MAETVAAIKAVFAAWEGKSPLNFRGEFFTHTLMPPNFNPGPNPYGPPPVLLGALGPVMTRTAAEVADALLVMPFNSAAALHRAHAARGGRGPAPVGSAPGDFRLIVQAMVAVGRTEAELAAASTGWQR